MQRPEIQNQGVFRVIFSPKTLEEYPFLLFLVSGDFLLFSGILGFMHHLNLFLHFHNDFFPCISVSHCLFSDMSLDLGPTIQPTTSN